MIVYTKTACGWCKELKDFLAEKGIKYEERNVFENDDFLEELKEKTNQTKTPSVILNDEIFADTSKDEFEKILLEKELLKEEE